MSDILGKSEMHAFLSTRLKKVKRDMDRLYHYEYEAPRCVKCDGILSKMDDPSKLICLKCGAKYELKEL